MPDLSFENLRLYSVLSELLGYKSLDAMLSSLSLGIPVQHSQFTRVLSIITKKQICPSHQVIIVGVFKMLKYPRVPLLQSYLPQEPLAQV